MLSAWANPVRNDVNPAVLRSAAVIRSAAVTGSAARRSIWATVLAVACMHTSALIRSRELVHAPPVVSDRAPIPAAAVERAVFVGRMLKVLVIEVTPNEDNARVTDAVSDCKAMTQRICTFSACRHKGSCLSRG